VNTRVAHTACIVLASALAPLGAFAQERQDRPIRGVWLRPPSSLQSLENSIDLLAEAGVQDLFLETFYHGLTTHQSDVFRDRFTFDYLAEAIRIANRRSIRVHAWVEAGYWSFSGSGDYILNRHPEWKVVDVYGNTDIGDISGQVFVNLGHPGVQGRLADLSAELAAYPGLEGVHTDYHRFPLDNNTGDNIAAPYSFDAWSRQTFQSMYGADPLDAARRSGDPLFEEFVAFRRESIGLAADAMNRAMKGVEPGIVFSAAVFASATTNSSQLVKMQDWPSWAADGFIDIVVPMAYGTSTTSIRNDLRTTNNLAGGRRVVAGLAILTNTSRPSITEQLNVAKGEGIEDFIFFEGSVLTASAAKRAELADWIRANATPQAGDFDINGSIDARDRDLFALVWDGGDPVPVNGRNRRYDLSGDGFIDGTDRELFERAFDRFRFGEDGVVDGRDLQALLNVWTGPGDGQNPPDILNLYDLDGDGDVDYDDQLRLHAALTVDIGPDLDVNRDGVFDLDDAYAQNQNPIDVDRNGEIDPLEDTRVLIEALREGEQDDMSANR
jgi:uncharacterized lipoprotein YddW (UPF0748 family)